MDTRNRLALIWVLAVAALLPAMAGEDAAETYEQARKTGQQHARKQAYEEAWTCCRRALDLATSESQKGQALVGMADCDTKAGLYEQAVEEAEQGLACDGMPPDTRAAARELVGDCRMGQKRFPEAIEAYSKMRDMENAQYAFASRAWSKIGDVYFAMEEYSEARNAYEEAVANPKVAAIHLRNAWPKIGHCLMAESKHDEAREAYERVGLAPELSVGPREKMAALAGIGNAYYGAGDYPAACKAYLGLVGKPYVPRMLHIVERLDRIFRLQLNKADTLYAQGEYNEAYRAYERTLTMEEVEDHHRASALLGMAECDRAAKKHSDAIRNYRAVIDMKNAYWPDRGRAQAGIAKCYEAEGDTAKAREAYREVLGMRNVAESDVALARAKCGK